MSVAMLESPSKDFKRIISKAHELLIKDNDCQAAINYLENIINTGETKDIGVSYWLALSYLESGHYAKARDFYLTFDAFYHAGYCEVLMGNLPAAEELWKKCRDSEVKYWSDCFKSLLRGFMGYVPTFLGIRNHLEVDLGYLLRANQSKYAENIISLVDELLQINLESYKFVGKALLNNGYVNLAAKYLLEGQKILPNDPEIYYHLGLYSLQVNAPAEARNMFKHCILISPAYTPAKDRLRELK